MSLRSLFSVFFSASFLTVTLPASAANVTVRLVCHSEPDCSGLTGHLVLQSPSGRNIAERIPLNGVGTVTALVPGGSMWNVSLEAAGFWAPARLLSIASDDAEPTLDLEVWRTGRLRVRVQTADEPVTELRAVVTAPPSIIKSVIPDGASFPCARSNQGWLCELPAANVDLSLRAAGFAPHYRFDVAVSTNRLTDLGTITLKKGGSIAAWLDPDSLKRLTEPASAILRHRTAGGSTGPAVVRLAKPVVQAKFNTKGMVQLAPLAAGPYVLEVQSAGFAPASIPVEAAEGREQILRHPIELFPAVNARLRIEPPQSSDGLRWQVQVSRRVDFGTGWISAAGGEASPEGIFELREQPEGPVRVVVRDSRRNKLASQEIVLMDGSEHTIALDLAAIVGRVTLGNEPLPNARLLFATNKERVATVADESGEFTITLPQRGKYRVEGKSPDASVYGTAEVEIGPADESIVVAFSATEVSGWVVDPDGRRASAAEVTLATARSAHQVRTGADGTFSFRGVSPGDVQLSARSAGNGLTSRIQRISIPKEKAVPNVVLSLERVRRVHGTLRSQGTPVPGAWIDAYAITGAPSEKQRATTDATGAFAFDAPESAGGMLLIVGAPGRVLESFRIPVGDEPVSLDVAPRGGMLFLRWPADAHPLRVVINNAVIPMPNVWEWARDHGQSVQDHSIVIPAVAPGKLQFCTRERCVEGTLAVGGRLDLDLTRSTVAP